MSPSSSASATIFWYSLLFLFGAAVTCAAFAVFVSGPDRTTTFYVAQSVVIAAELTFFAHLLHSKLVKAGAPSASRATRIQVQVLIFIWFLLSVIVGAVIAHPKNADTVFADKVLVIHLILTFIFFASTYFLYAKDIEVERADRQLAQERKAIQLNMPDVERVMGAVAELGAQHAAHAVLADRVGKKLDRVRSELDSTLVSERGLDRPEEAQEWNARIEKEVSELVRLSGEVAAATAEQAPAILNDISEKAEDVLSTLRRREQSLTS